MKYLLLPAHTSSEWDSVSFALIELPPSRDSYIKKMIKRQLELEKEGINVLGVFSDNAEFYNDETQLPKKCLVAGGGIMPNVKAQVVSLRRTTVDKLTQPEQTLRYGRMEFLGGGVKFITYGKHTGEEFYTDSIVLDVNGNFNFLNK